MVRPKGGRAAPRYHRLKNTNEDKLIAAVDRRERESVVPQPTKADLLIRRLATTGDKVDRIVGHILYPI